jgi:hypothetical protein
MIPDDVKKWLENADADAKKESLKLLGFDAVGPVTNAIRKYWWAGYAVCFVLGWTHLFIF